MPTCLKYEKHNDSLQEAIEQISAEDCDNTDSDENDDDVTEEREDLGFFDPERPQGQTLHDIRIDEGDDPKYATEHYHVSVRLPETEYLELMRSLNKQQ